jgi:hypothetical protein
MSGHWPPEWEDPEGEFPEGAGELDTEAEARLSEVAAYLASVPVPALPDVVEARISAALATEATARADHAAPADGSRKLGPPGAPARVGRHRGSRRPRRGFRLRPQVVGGSLVTCLLLAVLGFALSNASFSSSSSSGPAAGSAAGVSSAAASSAAGSGTAAGAEPPAAASSAAAAGSSAGAGSSFAVTASGTRYQQVTLAEQVHARLTANGAQPSGVTAPAAGATVPAASASATSASVAPSSTLRGCVLHLTGNELPRLVDRAIYQGEPAYVIASSSRVWVVGLGCTAAKPELVASVPLAG